jgi:hypothetical protein
MLVDADDRGHEIGDDPRAQESLLWNVILPDDDVFVIAYVARKAQATARMLIAFGDEAGPIALEIEPGGEFDGEDLSAFTVAGMAVRQPEPLTRAEVRYAGDRFALDYRFDAIHDAFDFARNRDGCVPVAATNRFEQSGRISGEIRVDDRTVAFDATGHRDHSWGVRDYPAILHYKWISAQAGPDLSFHAMHTWWRGREYTNGYVWRDGELSGIVRLDVETDYDEQMLQRTARYELLDEAGRVTRATSERFAGGFLALGDVVLAEAGSRFEIEGEAGAGCFEQGWQPGYLEHLRANPTAEAVGSARAARS